MEGLSLLRWADVKPPSGAAYTLTVDDEGVVRVVQATSDKITVSPEELGLILTALIKALVGSDDEEQSIAVQLK